MAVREDLATFPFLADRRVVLIREADSFLSGKTGNTVHRESLEKYLGKPSPTGTLILECRSFPKTTRLCKAAGAAGGEVHECRKPALRALPDFVAAEAHARGKRIEPAAAARLVNLIGQETGMLVAEVEKLALYVADRPTITDHDVSELVGQSREEKIFAVMDAAATGRLRDALHLWHQALATDPKTPFTAVGGVSWKVRNWLNAHRMAAGGATVGEIAPKVMMWRREAELQTILRRLSPLLLRRLLAHLASLDSQAKSGARSIETGIELMLVRLAM